MRAKSMAGKAALALIFLLSLAAMVLTIIAPPRAGGEEFTSYSHVQEDGSLLVNGKKVWLYGIYLPLDDRTCRTYEIPIRCGQRSLLALEFKIEPYFVTCEEMAEREDGSIIGRCAVKGEDLSAWMLQQGWAVALPDAPFEYQVLEKIARRKGLGIWGRIIGPR